MLQHQASAHTSLSRKLRRRGRRKRREDKNCSKGIFQGQPWGLRQYFFIESAESLPFSHENLTFPILYAVKKSLLLAFLERNLLPQHIANAITTVFSLSFSRDCANNLTQRPRPRQWPHELGKKGHFCLIFFPFLHQTNFSNRRQLKTLSLPATAAIVGCSSSSSNISSRCLSVPGNPAPPHSGS